MSRSQRSEERKDGLRVIGKDESKVMRKTVEVQCTTMLELVTIYNGTMSSSHVISPGKLSKWVLATEHGSQLSS